MDNEARLLEIYKYGSPILRKTMPEVTEISDELLTLINDMFFTMYEEEGIGLSANQVGAHFHLAVIGASLVEDSELNDFPIINAKFLASSGSESAEEGCLSFPDIREEITRSTWIKLQYYDENLVKHEKEFNGLLARVIQHELDHLNGIYFIDKISSIRRKLLKNPLKAISETQKHHR